MAAKFALGEQSLRIVHFTGKQPTWKSLVDLALDKAIGRKLALRYPSAPVEPEIMEPFRCADKHIRRPGEMEKADVDRLREAG